MTCLAEDLTGAGAGSGGVTRLSHMIAQGFPEGE